MSKREPQKQIPSWLYKELEEFASGTIDTELLRSHVSQVVERKKSNDADHILYSASKDTRRSLEEREIARRIYVERRNIPESFRW